MIVWLIGISGAGKTTVGRALVEKMRTGGRPTLFIDGDEIRTVWKDDLGHTVEARRRNHSRLSQLCKVLDQDGVDIIVSALSIFPDLRAWNRRNLRHYLEVFLDLPLKEARSRDPKGIYAKRARGESRDVVGVDIPFPLGETVDLHIIKPEILDTPDNIANRILDLINNSETARPSSAGEPYRYAGRDLLETPETYEFAPCRDDEFFNGWQTHRSAAMAACLAYSGRLSPPPLGDCVENAPIRSEETGGKLTNIMSSLYHAAETAHPESEDYRNAKRTMDEFVKKFEIFRRLYDQYDENLKRGSGASVVDIDGYCVFGAALIAFHRRTGVPIYSSTLLKLLDAILSRGTDDLDTRTAGKITALLQGEDEVVRYWERHTESLKERRGDSQT